MNIKYNCDSCLHKSVCKYNADGTFIRFRTSLSANSLLEEDFDVLITCKNYISCIEEEANERTNQ